ncbi:autotransporter assembly complex protein TamA [Thaumasiovibrio sp. DFM-14]|uniref:autotransporter assembly complex protein TamA n=1 Tax=Thaumasiovibrio sp. DFM-14 TaxID=3384792 RepID=UPI0039A2527B
MRWFFTIGISLLLGSFPVAAKVIFDVKGLDSELRRNIELYLATVEQQRISNSERFRKQFKGEMDNALKALGYYSPQYQFDVQRQQDDTRVIIHVDPGPPTQIVELDIQLIGQQDPDLLALITDSKIEVGERLHHGKYEALKAQLRSTALKKGYFDAKFIVSDLKVAPSRQQAFLILRFETGQRYRFGPTMIIGSQIKDERVRSLLPYRQGDNYLSENLVELNQALSNTGWFASIFVEPKIEQAQDYAIPVVVTLSPQAKNQVEVGLGYSTDVGARMQLNWNKPWVHTRGHSWNTKMELSAVQPKVETVYKIPLDDVKRDYYQIVGGLRYVDSHDTVSTEISAGFERHWRLDSGWKRTASIRYLYEDYKQGADEQGQMQLFVPGLTYSRNRTRGTGMPMWGDSQFISFEYADPALGSDTEILRMRGRTGWIRSLGDRHRGLLKVDGGTILADGISNVPPSMRFFAGGDNSLRGYGYESIAPRDSGGQLRGARHLLTTTLEYQLRVYGNWWLAAFYDYGDAWNRAPDWKSGVGGGIRWSSPVGPVRLDVGFGLENTSDDYRIHFTLGPEF